MTIKLEDVQAFVKIAEFGGFTRAADELGITQSALSRRMKKLEEAFGARLLDRTTRRVSVSVVGQEFLPEAIRLVAEFDRSLQDIRDLVQRRSGSISIASNMTLADTLLPEIVETFRRENPDVRVRISESSSPPAMESVLRRETEMALGQFGLGHPELQFEPLLEDHFVLVCHQDHPLATRERVTWQDLGPYNFIRLRSGSGTTTLLRQTFGENLGALNSNLEVGHFHSILAFVSQNLGVSAIPTLVRLKRRDLNLVTRPINEPTIGRKLGIVTYRGRSLSPACQAFRHTCRVVFRRFATELALTDLSDSPT